MASLNSVVVVFLESLKMPLIIGPTVVSNLLLFALPGFVLGLVLGWSWKPKFPILSSFESLTATTNSKDSNHTCLLISSLPSILNQRFVLPFPWISTVAADNYSNDEPVVSPINSSDEYCSSDSPEPGKSIAVTSEDVEHLCQLVEGRDGGRPWTQILDRHTPTMLYQAWHRDPEIGPPQYRSRSVYQDVTPELVRDFFWDDDFRSNWDDMLIRAETLEECPITGTMLVHWTRKFPFFCSDREYIIGRRIWEAGRSYYCVTKGVPCSSVPRRNKPRRVDLYYSSYCIRAVESNKGDGQLSACEVLLFHHEDMGIPREIAKFGIGKGMWGAVKKIEPGLRAYQKSRASTTASLSRCAFMAQLNTKLSADYLRSLEVEVINSQRDIPIEAVETLHSDDEKPTKTPCKNLAKLLIVGGAVVLACSLDRGLLTKTVVSGVVTSLFKIGRRL
ncbi:hypothetical protein MKW98_001663 [Papaver atlanticum]|uniref:START domain-containing protein n=1 Tax=Papaver atlanticum TaxID=357466 RepID=A0AAD4S6C9_9MAGN|nr:hypothetical protein MKW98_001663 [Papaver atlanticum]